MSEQVPATDAFPENELPRWLWRKAMTYGRRAALAVRSPCYQQLSRFSHDLATCVGSSADIVRGLELCLKPLRGTKLGDRWSGAVEQVRRGASLSAALSPAEELLPPFYLPVIRAGEQSGRLDEALRFLDTHCKLLAGPASALRNLWLLPVAILLMGSGVRFLLILILGSFGEAFAFLFGELFSWLQLVLIVAIAILTPVRYFVDQARLSLPLIGPLEREIALHRFFRVLAPLYSVGGHRVETMIETAAETVSNSAARLELRKAANAVQDKETIPDAFRHVNILSADEKAAIEVGEMSGTLELAFDRISDDTGASMIAKIKFVEPILVRIVMAVVTFSIITTMFSLIMQWAL